VLTKAELAALEDAFPLGQEPSSLPML